METAGFVIHPAAGFLIVYEGISGSGKSEGIRQLKQELAAGGMRADVAEWNSNRTIRSLTVMLDRRGWLTPGLYSFLQWFGFWIDYRRFIAPRLKQGGIVIADRYVYTGLTRDVANGAASLWGRLWMKLVRRPDIVFFYDTPPMTCHHRIQSRGKALFIPGSFVANGEFCPDRELNYLKRMRDEYVRLFASESVSRSTNIVWVKEEVPETGETVKAYWFAKTGAEPAWAFQPDDRTVEM
jgi:dTMP kinase